MTKSLLLSIALFAASGSALADVGFFEAESAKQAPFRGFERAKEATFKLFNGLGGNKCSAAKVSNSGHVLTAAHCITECLKEHNLIKEPVKLTPNIKIYEFDTEKVNEQSCLVEFNSSSALVNLMAVGPGELEFIPSKLSDEEWALVEDLKAKGFGVHGDWALLKGYGMRTACVPVTKRQPAKGEKLIALGYPTLTNRLRDNNNSDGRSQFYSIGTRTEGLEDIEGLKETLKRRSVVLSRSLDQAIVDFGPDGALELWKRKENTSDVIFSNVDLVSGNSGGPLFDVSGSLIGINVNLYALITPKGWELQHFTSGTSGSVSMNHIMKKLEEKFDASDIKRIFNCPVE